MVKLVSLFMTVSIGGILTDRCRHKARFFDMDFSAALKSRQSGSEAQATTKAVPSYINYTGRMAAVRNSGPLLGKDAHGNWWLQWTLRADAWPAVQASLDRLANGII